MSASQSQWIWDPNRGFYYQLLGGYYRYQDGTIRDRKDQVVPSSANNPQTYSSQPVVDTASTTPTPNVFETTHSKGAFGQIEPSQSDYKYRHGESNVGRVFRVLYPKSLETTADDFPSSLSQISYDGKSGLRIAWFVTVLVRETWSLCLRIQTYDGQGCMKAGVRQSEHAIIHSSSRPPHHLPGEDSMLPPIRVSACSITEELGSRSRLNLAKLYRVDHNVKIYDFGTVHRRSMKSFLSSWKAVSENSQRAVNVSEEPSEESKGAVFSSQLPTLDFDTPSKELEAAVSSTSQPVLTQPAPSLAVHSNLVMRYAAFIKDEGTGEEAAAFLSGTYTDQVGTYTALMKRGIIPEEREHNLLVVHCLQLCRQIGGQRLETFRERLEKGSVEEQAEVYATLLATGHTLPTLTAPKQSSFDKPSTRSSRGTRSILSTSETISETIPSSINYSELDSGKGNPRNFATDSAEQPASTVKGYDDNYSAAGSISGREHEWREILQDALIQDLDVVERSIDGKELSALIEHFAIRLGSQGSGDHQRMMFVAHQYSQLVTGRLKPAYNMSQTTFMGSEKSGEDDEARVVGSDFYHEEQIATWASGVSGAPKADTKQSSDQERQQAGAEQLKASEAYQWLIVTLRNWTSLDCVEATSRNRHRATVLSELNRLTEQIADPAHRRISPRRPPNTFEVVLRLEWDIMGFIASQDYTTGTPAEVLKHIITLTGDEHHVQALSCGAYLAQVWPSTGEDILQAISDTLQRGESEHERMYFRYGNGRSPSHLRISDFLRNGTVLTVCTRHTVVSIKILGTKYGVAEATEQLLWLSTALRHSGSEGSVTLNDSRLKLNPQIPPEPQVKPRHTPPGSYFAGTMHASATYRSFPAASETSEHLKDRPLGSCWRSLFGSCHIVVGYPIPSRNPRVPGLQVELDLLSALVGAERVELAGSNIVLKGFSDCVYLTQRNDDMLLWHFITNNGEWIEYTDRRIDTADIPTGDVSPGWLVQNTSLQHIIGWGANIRSLIGSSEALYDIRASNLKKPGPGFAFEKVQISAGQFLKFGTTIQLGRRDRPIHMRERGDDFLGRLVRLGDKHVVLFDVERRRAWFSNGVSALLHLLKASLTYFAQHRFFENANWLRPEDIGDCRIRNGGKAAYDILSDPARLALRVFQDSDFSETVKDRVKELMHYLERIYSEQTDARGQDAVLHRIRSSPAQQLEGFDFSDIATLKDSIEPREIKLKQDGETWTKLAKDLNAAVLFGGGFGDLMEPEVSLAECLTCGWHSRHPCGFDTLAALISDVEVIVARNSPHEAPDWHLSHDVTVTVPFSLFESCHETTSTCCSSQRVLDTTKGKSGHQNKESSKHLNTKRLFAGFRSSPMASPHRTMTATDITTVTRGAVLFGSSSNRKREFVRKNRCSDHITSSHSVDGVQAANSNLRNGAGGALAVPSVSSSTAASGGAQRSTSNNTVSTAPSSSDAQQLTAMGSLDPQIRESPDEMLPEADTGAVRLSAFYSEPVYRTQMIQTTEVQGQPEEY